MEKKCRWSCLSLASLIVLVLGCNTGGPGCYLVEGTVIFDGKPLSKASIAFIPEVSGAGALFASGDTDESGVFTLTAAPNGKAGQGTTPGRYLVTVTRYQDKPSGEEKTPLGPIPIYSLLIPKRYTDQTASGLTATVEEKKKNEFTFELTK